MKEQKSGFLKIGIIAIVIIVIGVVIYGVTAKTTNETETGGGITRNVTAGLDDVVSNIVSAWKNIFSKSK